MFSMAGRAAGQCFPNYRHVSPANHPMTSSVSFPVFDDQSQIQPQVLDDVIDKAFSPPSRIEVSLKCKAPPNEFAYPYRRLY
jgi:hypothetical protein